MYLNSQLFLTYPHNPVCGAFVMIKFITQQNICKILSQDLNVKWKKKTRELPISLPIGCTWATEWAAIGLPMGFCHANKAAHFFHIWK